MPSTPSRTKYMMNSAITSSYDTLQPMYEDPDAPKPVITDESQPEVKVKPVPRPRTKLTLNAQCNNINSTEQTSCPLISHSNEYSEDYKRPRPVRPPPSPPKKTHQTSSKLSETIDGHCMSSNTVETSNSETPPSSTPPRPERPALPSVYYGTKFSVSRQTSKTCNSEDYQRSSEFSTCSNQQSPVPPGSYEDPEILNGTHYQTVNDIDKPAVPPRPPQTKQAYLSSGSLFETLPSQARPPPPPFSPPPPPSEGTEPLYSEIQFPPYLHVLPEDDDKTSQWSSTLRSHCWSSQKQKMTGGPEEITEMIKWLKIVSRSDHMALSVYGVSIEEEIRSFNQTAMNVKKALRLYNLLMMKRCECLRVHISELTSITNTLDKAQKTSKTMNIAGGTTGAVGGGIAVVGIALAPVTMGASLIATAVGAGMVASAGGMGAHGAKARKKAVNRSTMEKLINEYKENVVDMEQCLNFILSGMNELRRYDIARLQRAGAQPDAIKMAHLSQSVFASNMNNFRKSSAAHTGGMSSEWLLKNFAKEMDLYFSEKDGEKLKKSRKSKFSGRVRLLAENLQDELEYLNHMWELFC